MSRPDQKPSAGTGRYTRAFSTLGCPQSSLAEAFSLAARHGIGAVELRALGGSLHLPAHFAEAGGTPAALAGMVQGAGVRIVAIDTNLRIVGGTTADREKFLAFLPWAEALGVRRLRVFDGGKTAGEAGLAEAAATVRWWRELRAAKGWQADIMVETHDSLLCGASIQRFAEAVPGTAVLWDSFNTWLRSGEDPVTTWRAISRCVPAVPHIHVKDGARIPHGKHSFTAMLPGSGEFPMARLLPELRAGFDGVLSLEWEKAWHPYLPPLDEALRTAAERDWW
jgi:sugar phosphate isomerase/epimerase